MSRFLIRDDHAQERWLSVPEVFIYSSNIGAARMALDVGAERQQKFLDHAALQCGICTPGILVAAKALLEKNPSPNETEVRYWLAGNLCRCTGYDKIIRAVMDAAEEMRG